MKLQKALEILENHNKWRRDKNVPSIHEQINPFSLGFAIDTVVNYHKPKCTDCKSCQLLEKENIRISKTHFCELTEENINDIEQHYCDEFEKE